MPQEGSLDLDLLSTLNIVTTPVPSSSSSSSLLKKERSNVIKKQSKFQRRRYLAEKAKSGGVVGTNQKHKLGRKNKKNFKRNIKHSQQNNNNNDNNNNDKIQHKEKPKQTTTKPPPTTRQQQGNEKSSVKPVDKKATTSHETNKVSIKDKDNVTQNGPENEDELKNKTLLNQHSSQVLSCVENKPKRINNNNENYADYLAEFHARPLELDRRAGVTNKYNNTASFESSHLFSSQSKWSSVSTNLHSRLVQTLETQFNLSKPTTIQTKALETFHQTTNNNIMIHSETGSGKTLAYILPIVQSLATDKQTNQIVKIDRKTGGTRCIILCPTRELAIQTMTVLEQLCTNSFGWLVPGCLSGGGDNSTRKSEKARIRKGLSIIVATPGRLLDHLNKTESLLLSLKGKLEWFVLDEADRLLDMGLGDQVRQIVQLLCANDVVVTTTKTKTNNNNNTAKNAADAWWRTVLVSATITPHVQALAKERMLCGNQEWVWVKASSSPTTTTAICKHGKKKLQQQQQQQESKVTTDKQQQQQQKIQYNESTPRQLAQLHVTVSAKMRLSTLIAFLVQRVLKKERTVVFMSTCSSVEYHYKLFHAMDNILSQNEQEEEEETKNYNDSSKSTGIFGSQGTIFRLHGNIQHVQRQSVLQSFGNNNNDNTTSCCNILFATDVAARGLNLQNVDWIVQYDPPCEVTDYIHRIGRVARAGQAGHSLLMLLPSERGFLDILQEKGATTSLSALSLASILNVAAQSCPKLIQKSIQHGNKSRLGETFCTEIQRQLEECVLQNDIQTKEKYKQQKKKNNNNNKRRMKHVEGELMELARTAYLSHIRAYPTKEKCIRHVFSARALHLGHLARSFALKEPPKKLAHKEQSRQDNNNISEKNGNKVVMNSNKRKYTETTTTTMTTDSILKNNNNNDKEQEQNNNHDFEQPLLKKQYKQASSLSLFSKDSNSGSKRQLLLANAVKMQNNLMDAM